MAKFRFKYGVMNSGKSQELLRIWYSYTGGNVNNKNVMVMTPATDDRYGVGKVTTRSGNSIAAEVVDQNRDVAWYLDNYKGLGYTELECILVDEINFFTPKDVQALKSFVLDKDIPVIAFGLLKDFQNNLFPGSREAVIVAELMQEVESKCHYCNSKAIMNKRIDKDGNKLSEGNQIEIEGPGTRYVQVCHKHWRV